MTVTDNGTTWFERDLLLPCTQDGVSAVPGLAVPGCMIPGFYNGLILPAPNPL